jgi:hypothetical protein
MALPSHHNLCNMWANSQPSKRTTTKWYLFLVLLSDGPKWKHQREIITSLEREGGNYRSFGGEHASRIRSLGIGWLFPFLWWLSLFVFQPTNPQTTVSLSDNFNSLVKIMYHRAMSLPFIEFLPSQGKLGVCQIRSSSI